VSIVETFHELQLLVPHLQHLVVEEETEEMAQVINTVVLRMRPDLIMIGEVVSQEAEQFIKALNLGIRCMTTTHSQNARLALTRLEVLSGESEMALEQRQQIMGTGDLLIVHLTKEYDERQRRYRRYMQEIIAVKGYNAKAGDYDTRVLKRFDGNRYTPLEGM